MQFDVDYIKKIIATMVEYPGHRILNFALFDKLGINLEQGDIGGPLDKFLGHIHILKDSQCVACSVDHLGFEEVKPREFQVKEADYRLTAEGYELYDLLRSKTVSEVCKHFS